MSCNIKTIKTCEIFSDSIFARSFSFNEALQKVTAKIQKSDSANVQNIELTKISNMFSLEIEPLNLAVGNYKITYIFEILISGKLIRKTGLIENLSILKIGCNCEKSENENLDFSIELNQTVIDVELNFSVLNIGSISESGKSAFDIAVENGFVGTEIEWLLSLKGEKGDKGEQGVQGEKGVKGDAGPKGSDASVTKENISAALGFTPTKPLNIKITTPSSWVTGTMSETEVLRIEIPANSLSDSDVLRIPFLMINKVGTNGTIQIKGRMSTSTTMPSGGTDHLFQTAIVAATNQYVGLDRSFIINDGKIKGFPAGNTAYTSSTISPNPIQQKAFNRTVTNYLYISIQLGNTADQAILEGMQLTNS